MIRPIHEVISRKDSMETERKLWDGETYREKRDESRKRVNRMRPNFGKRKSA